MKVKDLLDVIKDSGIPAVRIRDKNVPQGNNRDNAGVMLCEYLDNLSHKMNVWQPFADCEVLQFKVNLEVSHKLYKEKGLIPPFRPDLTPEYSFSDLNVKLYYDVYIDGQTVADGWKR